MESIALEGKLQTKDQKLSANLTKNQFFQKQTERYIKLNDLLTQDEPGLLEADEGEHTLQFRQNDIQHLLPVQNALNIFDLDLDFGQYSLDYSRNGRELLLGGSQGHLSMIDWKQQQLITEIQVRETIRDVKFLHNYTMFAVAQQSHVFIYDNMGIELHKLKSHLQPSHLQYLPYHFLLVSASRLGFLKYHDTSTGSIVSEFRMKTRQPCCMSQNPFNSIICVGDNQGQVSMYSPNTSEAIVQILAHKSSVSSLSVTQNGNYLATVGTDCAMKVWDIRTYKCVYEYWTQGVAKKLDISQRGLLAVNCGPSRIQIWKDWYLSKQTNPYMKHETKNFKPVCDFKFTPYQDFLGIGLDGGFSSVVVPGSGEPNYDSFEANPFQNKKQRKEDVVHKLLDKLPSTTITLNPNIIGTIDTASKDVIDAEEQKEDEERDKKKKKKIKRKMRGRSKVGQIELKKAQEKEERVRAQLKDFIHMSIRRQKAEKEKKKKEVEILNNLENISNFDPVAIVKKQIQKDKASNKIKKIIRHKESSDEDDK